MVAQDAGVPQNSPVTPDTKLLPDTKKHVFSTQSPNFGDAHPICLMVLKMGIKKTF